MANRIPKTFHHRQALMIGHVFNFGGNHTQNHNNRCIFGKFGFHKECRGAMRRPPEATYPDLTANGICDQKSSSTPKPAAISTTRVGVDRCFGGWQPRVGSSAPTLGFDAQSPWDWLDPWVWSHSFDANADGCRDSCSSSIPTRLRPKA